jgi:hypothetical protein
MIPFQTLTLALCLRIAEQAMTVMRILPLRLVIQEPVPPTPQPLHGRVVIPARKWFARGYRRN